MNENMNIQQGSIVLVPFPFSDLSAKKTRPALVLSRDKMKGNDIIVCAITTKGGGFYESSLTNRNLMEGVLPLDSYVRPHKLVSLDRHIIRRVVAKVSDNKMREILGIVRGLLK